MADPVVSAGLKKFLGLVNKTKGNSGITAKNTTLGVPAPGTSSEHPAANTKVAATLTKRNGEVKQLDLFYTRLDIGTILGALDGGTQVNTDAEGVLQAQTVIDWLATHDIVVDAEDLVGLPHTVAPETELDSFDITLKPGALNYIGEFTLSVYNEAYEAG